MLRNQTPMTTDLAERLYCDPSTGSIRRRALGRWLNGIVAVGPSAGLRLPVPEPTKTELAAAEKHDAEIRRQHEQTVKDEIAALDKHTSDVADRIEALSSMSTTPDYALQEYRSEYRMLVQLRGMLESDLASGPIRTDRDGREVDDRLRAIVRLRAKEVREAKWESAARADAEGDRRRARTLRIDALRSRHLSEHEHGLRSFLAGYSQPWS